MVGRCLRLGQMRREVTAGGHPPQLEAIGFRRLGETANRIDQNCTCLTPARITSSTAKVSRCPSADVWRDSSSIRLARRSASAAASSSRPAGRETKCRPPRRPTSRRLPRRATRRTGSNRTSCCPHRLIAHSVALPDERPRTRHGQAADLEAETAPSPRRPRGFGGGADQEAGNVDERDHGQAVRVADRQEMTQLSTSLAGARRAFPARSPRLIRDHPDRLPGEPGERRHRMRAPAANAGRISRSDPSSKTSLEDAADVERRGREFGGTTASKKSCVGFSGSRSRSIERAALLRHSPAGSRGMRRTVSANACLVSGRRDR